jgi:GNAT superfamily N-acetyltransferase
MASTIRRAEERDIPGILTLLRQVCNVHSEGRPDIFIKDGTKYGADELSVLLHDETRPVFVYVNESEEVLGYGFCVIIDYEGGGALVKRRELYLDDLCVDKSQRGGGIGSALFSHIKSFAKEIGCYHLTLNVWACNPTAMAFYESRGMQMLKKEMEVIL